MNGLRRRIHLAVRIGAFGAGIGILLGLISTVGFRRFWTLLLGVSPWWIGAAVVVYAAGWGFRTWRMGRFTARAGRDLGALDLFKLLVSGYALNSVLPARIGDAAIVVYLRTRGIDFGKSAAIVVQTRILDALALILLSVPGFLLILRGDTPVWVVTAVLLCFAVVITPMATVVVDRRRRISTVLERLKRTRASRPVGAFVGKLKDAYEGYHDIVRDRRLLGPGMVLSLLMGLCEGLTCYAIAVGAGVEVSVGAVILAVSVANIAKTVPVTPGGIGVYEGILAGILVLCGVGADVAVVIGVLDHGIKKAFNVGCGGLATASLGIGWARIRRLAEATGGCGHEGDFVCSGPTDAQEGEAYDAGEW